MLLLLKGGWLTVKSEISLVLMFKKCHFLNTDALMLP